MDSVAAAEGLAGARVSVPNVGLFLGVLTTIAVWIYQPKYKWTAIERHYLTPYMLVSAGWFEKFAVLHTVDAKGKSHPGGRRTSNPST